MMSKISCLWDTRSKVNINYWHVHIKNCYDQNNQRYLFIDIHLQVFHFCKVYQKSNRTGSCYVSFGQKRDKWIVLSSNIISWKCISVITFCHKYFFFIWFCLHLLFFRSLSWIFLSGGGNSITSTCKAPVKAWRWYYVVHTCFWVEQEV